MNTALEQIMLEAAKAHLQQLDDEQFLAVSCDLQQLHDGIIRIVYHQSLRRMYRAPRRVTDKRERSKEKINNMIQRGGTQAMRCNTTCNSMKRKGDGKI